MEERNKKDIAVQQAIAQTRAEMGDHKGDGGITVVTYEGWSAQQAGQIPNIMVATEADSGGEVKH